MQSKLLSKRPNVTDALSRVRATGVSIWLDDLSRERLAGSLQNLIATRHISGVTTNPAIFSAAIIGSGVYQDDLKRMARAGLDAGSIIKELTITDVQEAAKIFTGVFEESNGVDGRVSIEVDPELARNAEETIASGVALWEKVAKDNVLIKVPATKEGLVAIEELTSRGISVNVTLIFTPERYKEVISAYFNGLERRLTSGGRIDTIHSVASFFISRIDSEIDKRLRALLTPQDFAQVRGKAAIANALIAYQVFQESLTSTRWSALRDSGAQMQRPLWASTGVKDPDYPATLYVESLLTAHSVNTMPESTLQAVASLPVDHPLLEANSDPERFHLAQQQIERLKDYAIDINEIGSLLEDEGLEKFVSPWRELHSNVQKRMTE